ncbi:dimethylsulfonioproprionate lyase family protein [Aestuariivirga sp.]|uniref:dimethylsulfonioproprionate lyase family protein n=1 Tax=Aestuariivirga sp. TaxID=2650926 RepID=UPI003783B287
MVETLQDNVRWLIGAVARGLGARHGEGVADVLDRLAQQDLDTARFAAPEPRALPVLAHLPHCLGEAMLLDADLAAAIASVEESLQWRQSACYSDALLGEGFTANYGWAEIIGPNGFFPGDDFLLGLLMLGPERHYRDHFHPAPELYWPLTTASHWSVDSGPFVEKQQGATIWHAPMAMHATITRDMPLLAVWSWTRDTATPARLRVT